MAMGSSRRRLACSGEAQPPQGKPDAQIRTDLTPTGQAAGESPRHRALRLEHPPPAPAPPRVAATGLASSRPPLPIPLRRRPIPAIPTGPRELQREGASFDSFDNRFSALVLHLQIHHLLELEFYITNVHHLLELALFWRCKKHFLVM